MTTKFQALQRLEADVYEHVLGFSDRAEVIPGKAIRQATEESWIQVFHQRPAELPEYFTYMESGGSFNRFTTRNGEAFYLGQPKRVFVPQPFARDLNLALRLISDREAQINRRLPSAFVDDPFWVVSADIHTESDASLPVAICKLALKLAGH